MRLLTCFVIVSALGAVAIGCGSNDSTTSGSAGGACGGSPAGGAGGDDGGGTGGTGVGGGGTGGSATGGAAGSGSGGSNTGGSGGSNTGGSGGSNTGGSGGSGGSGWNPACSMCHGSSANPAPPVDTSGNTATTFATVGAHQSHLTENPTWHRAVACSQCHIVPTNPSSDPAVPTHMNGQRDVVWGPLAQSGNFNETSATCSGVYCHGASLFPDAAGKTSTRVPTWTKVDGTQAACGQACHTLPPGGSHPAVTGNCEMCHGMVISKFDAANPKASLWADASLHVDGQVQMQGVSCTSCHGDAGTNNPAPPTGTHGETQTTEPAVGAHAKHLAAGSAWHRDGQCADCHTLPTSTGHSNGAVDFTWGAPANAGGASPTFVASDNTCTNAYCHGNTLLGPTAGGTVNRTPVWTEVNGTWNVCGSTCHTNPPGGTHTAATNCQTCHADVIAAYDPNTKTATWADRTKHINGTVESSGYHTLSNWVEPKGQPNHHGSHYFLENQQRDDKNTPCTQCHGANLDGGTSGVSCNNPSCHKGQDWRSCTFCHGTPPSQNNPPTGVGGETTTGTLAVGRHVAHLNASATHTAIACATCHVVPTAGNVAHALEYQSSASLATTGHHGDVTLSGTAATMTWNVAATQGNPASARGTCIGTCHSNGRGGAPVTTPYWAGGNWTTGNCGNCHAAIPANGRHDLHVNGEGLACTDCHPAANSATHANGTRDLNAANGALTIRPPNSGTTCGTRARCTGTCHGFTHSECW